MEPIKITNAHWLPKIGIRIAELCNKVNIKTILPDALSVYFAQIVQMGGNNAEFWVVMDENEPVAFASWFVKGLPHVGATYLDFIYNWSRKKDAVRLLVDEWMEFGKRNRCKYYDGSAINEQTMQIFKAYAEEINLEVEYSGITNFTCWRK